MEQINQQVSKFDYHDIKSVKMIVVIVNPDIENEVVDFLRLNGVRGLLMQRGHGAANKDILSQLGISQNDKTFITGLTHDNTAPQILYETAAKFFCCGTGKGLGFSLDIHGFAGARMLFKE